MIYVYGKHDISNKCPQNAVDSVHPPITSYSQKQYKNPHS